MVVRMLVLLLFVHARLISGWTTHACCNNQAASHAYVVLFLAVFSHSAIRSITLALGRAHVCLCKASRPNAFCDLGEARRMPYIMPQMLHVCISTALHVACANPAGVDWSAEAKMEAWREKTRRRKVEDDGAHSRMTAVGLLFSC